jgi:hypothetical protein
VGILWDLAFAGRFLVVLSVARSGASGPPAGAAGDARDVKCLAGAVNFLPKEAEIAALARSVARWLGSRGYLPAENRRVIAPSSLANASS